MAIVVAFDGSEASVKALDYAISEAKKRNADLWLVYVVPAERIQGGKKPVAQVFNPTDAAERYPGAIPEEVRAGLKEGQKKISEAGLNWESRVIVKGAGTGQDMVDFLMEMRERVDMAVLGVQKTSPTGKAIFGSTTQHVVLHAPCPVITVSPKMR